ncbi:MAG: YggT family protein [Alcaligenaceae bacterium]|nr:YggT family protein [Alcaligenaceae bacterium]
MTSMLLFLIQIIGTLFCAALLLGAWFYWLRIPAFNPLVANVTQLTNWLVIPLRKIFPSSRRFDTASLVGAYLTCAAQLLLMLLLIMGTQVQALLIYIPLEALLTLAKNILNLVFWLTLFYAIMSWINPLSPAMTLFRALLEPILTPIRNLPVLNRMQTIDLSPMVLIILCQFLLVGLRGISSPMFNLMM